MKTVKMLLISALVAVVVAPAASSGGREPFVWVPSL